MVLLADRHTPLGNEYGQQNGTNTAPWWEFKPENGHDGHAGERNALFVGLHVKKLQAPTFFNPSANRSCGHRSTGIWTETREFR